MFDFKSTLSLLLPALGEAGIDALAAEFDKLAAKAQTDWQKDMLTMVADAIEQHGPKGVDLAVNWVKSLLDGKKPVTFTGMDPLVASNLLAQIQNAEADEKSQFDVFISETGATLGTILGGILKGLLASV